LYFFFLNRFWLSRLVKEQQKNSISLKISWFNLFMKKGPTWLTDNILYEKAKKLDHLFYFLKEYLIFFDKSPKNEYKSMLLTFLIV
jgi:hypothetical protein